MKIYCHQCGRHTNSNELSKVERHANTDYEDPWSEVHRFTQCGGCDALTYSVESWSQDDWNPHTGEMDTNWVTYPRGEGERRSVDTEHDFPAKVRTIYKEVISAMNNQLPVLAGVGLRALIEAICRDQGIIGANLAALIDGLATEGVLSTKQAAILHTHRFLGNAAAHEITPAQPRELVAALDIAENVLRTIYVLPKLSAEVKTGKKKP
jgi:hypothetical protein